MKRTAILTFSAIVKAARTGSLSPRPYRPPRPCRQGGRPSCQWRTLSFRGCRLLCRFSDAGMTRLSTHCGGRRPKSAKARSRGKYGTRQCSECYGDRMLVAISMVDAAPARGDVHARMHVSPGECNGHLGGHTEFINGRLVN